MRILIVDDEPGVLRALERLFRRNGHEVRTAAHAAEALASLEEHAPEVVISDFLMAGMTGVEFLRQVAARTPAARRVLLSGYAEVDGQIDALFIRKPYDAKELLRLVVS
jgi:DNA-binding NtrC family response regulator